MYLLDTSVVCEARRGTRQAVAWLRSVDPAGVYLSVLTLGEIARGIAHTPTPDPAMAEWLRKLRHDHTERILPVTAQIAVAWGRIAAIRPCGEIAGLIAATAIVHDLVLVTREAADFSDMGADILDPWQVAGDRA